MPCHVVTEGYAIQASCVQAPARITFGVASEQASFWKYLSHASPPRSQSGTPRPAPGKGKNTLPASGVLFCWCCPSDRPRSTGNGGNTCREKERRGNLGVLNVPCVSNFGMERMMDEV